MSMLTNCITDKNKPQTFSDINISSEHEWTLCIAGDYTLQGQYLIIY